MKVLRVDYTKDDAAINFTQSLRETGFAVIDNHSIDSSLIQTVYAEWQQFFAADYKQKYLVTDFHRQDGFYPANFAEKAKGYSEKDLKEYFQFFPWGQFPTELSSNTLNLYQQLSHFAETLLAWVEQYTPRDIADRLSMPLKQMIRDSQGTMLRILHYPPLSGTEPAGAVRSAAHGDINLLTILVGATTSGLQVQDVHGNWHDVPSDKTSLVVNIGDMLETATEGYYKSTIHRVINPMKAHENVSRLSMPLFLHARSEVKISGERTQEILLNERLKELGVL